MTWVFVKRWWFSQRRRWIDRNGTHNQNVYDCVRKGELKRKIAPFLQSLFPNCGVCACCEWPWGLVDEHSTRLTESRGVFCLCESCWRHLREYGQENEIYRFYHLTREKCWHNVEVGDLDAALFKELSHDAGMFRINAHFTEACK